MTTIQQARDDWATLRNMLVASEGAIAQVIRNKSWEPLGYDSFSTAWAAEMRDITLAGEIRPHVAFYMFQEGYGPEWVAENLKGVSGNRAEVWETQWRDGLPPEMASRANLRPGADETVVSSHLRKKPSSPAVIRFQVSPAFYQEYKRIAKDMGTTVEAIARAATESTFDDLVNQKQRKRPA